VKKSNLNTVPRPDDETTGENTNGASLFLPIPIDSLPKDQPLPFPIYLRVSDQLILFRNPGDVLTQQRFTSLTEKNVGVGYVPEGSWRAFLRTLEDQEVGVKPGGPSESAEASIIRLRHLLLAYGQELERKRLFQKVHMDKLRELGYRLAVGIAKDATLGGKLLRKYTDNSLYFVNHSVNVAIYCAAVAHKLGVSTEDVKKLTFAALVHNVGNLFVPKDVLFKPGSLTRKEWEIVCTHPMEGAKLLESLNAPKEVVLTAMQHHERVDGLGYPEKMPGGEIHMFAKITSIADVFDALTSSNSYRKPLTPREAIEKMLSMDGKFDPAILKMLGNVK